MTRRLLNLLASAVMALAPCACVRTTEWADERPRLYGPLDKARRELGYGEFAAFDFGNHVVVYATGFECSTDWRHEIVPRPGPDGRPVLTLYREEPIVSGAAITRFTVSAVVRPAAPNKIGRMVIDVRDANGVHAVPVQPVPDAMTSAERSHSPRATRPAQ